jgi:hypothetical protein
MTINGGIFVLQQVYNKQISKVWPITAPIVKVPVTNLTTIDEGNSVVVNINTFDYIGQTLYWTISGVSGTINSSDFSAISDSFVVQSNNFGTFTITSTADVTTEGTESFVIQIRTDSTSGTIRATSGTITINDTSVQSKIKAYFASGLSGVPSSTVSTRIDRFFFSNDTVTATNRALMAGRSRHAGVGNFNVGYFGSGIVTKLTYSNETVTATVGSLSLGRSSLAATGNNDFGWFGGGYISPAPSPTTNKSRVDRINYASDTSTASIRGSLSLARRELAATGNNNFGWFGGGQGNLGVGGTTVDRIDFAADTGTASVSFDRRLFSASGNNNYGWFISGRASGNPSGNTTRIDRIDYASDLVVASIRGSTPGRFSHASAGSNDFGWFGGGTFAIPAVTPTASVHRITYNSDTVASSSRGPLASARRYLAAVSA